MPDINNPMGVPELNLQPPITSKVRLSEDMQQTLALSCAMGDSKRIMLRASESGALRTITPRIKDICGVTSTGAESHVQGKNISCSEVMIMGHPDNDVKVWVRPFAQYKLTAPNENIAWPVSADGVIGFVVTNISQLWFYFEGATDKVIIAYAE